DAEKQRDHTNTVGQKTYELLQRARPIRRLDEAYRSTPACEARHSHTKRQLEQPEERARAWQRGPLQACLPRCGRNARAARRRSPTRLCAAGVPPPLVARSADGTPRRRQAG